MASFSAGTTFTDGVANDVTAAKLGALVNNATPTSGFIQDRTAETITATNDTLLIGDASDSNNLKRITVANFAQTLPTAKITTGTIETGTFGTTTSTAATITTGTITTGVIPALTAGTTTSTAATITTGTIPTLVATTLITSGTGTAAAPAIVPTGDTNTGAFFPAADTMAISTNGTERVRVDSSGNVGIGNTVASTIISAAGGANGSLVVGSGSGVPNLILYGGASNYGSLYFADGTTGGDTFRGYVEYNHTDNFLRFGTNTNERLRIDSSGNVGIGVTPAVKLDLNGILTVRNSGTTFNSTPNTNYGLNFQSSSNGDTHITSYSNGGSTNMIFATNSGGAAATERLRITSGGEVCVGRTSSGAKLHIYNSGSTDARVAYFEKASGTTDGLYLACYAGQTTHLQILGNGNCQNANNSYGAVSDEKIKQDIVDASTQWNDIKNLRVRKFRFKSEPSMPLQIGLVAQEVELVSPHLVEETKDTDMDGADLGTTTKGVKYSVLYMKAVKALQEAMERIEQLESKVAALEAA